MTSHNRRYDEAGGYSNYTTKDLPASKKVRAFGVDYAHLSVEGGDLYLTRFGWPIRNQLHPANWYENRFYATDGERLAGATGTVYHVKSKPVNGRRADLIVKFSRVAQEVPLMIATTFPEDVSPEVIASARFNSPMEEFGLLMEMRRGTFGPADIRIRTQAPLAIYVPSQHYSDWQLGRDTSRFHVHRRLLAEDQENSVKAIELDIKRNYVLLYGWVKGNDAQAMWSDGRLSEEDIHRVTQHVIGELRMKGFRVLDNKPSHIILRQRRKDGTLLRRDRRTLTYAIVDYELLQRTPEYQKVFKESRRRQYQQGAGRDRPENLPPLASHLTPVSVFGINYLFGSTQDGGLLWVVGTDPGLWDFFVPDRWRRTPRIKLSSQNEVYRTRSRDSIDIVYRRSRVGSIPRVDPLSNQGREIREHGYNSPFEEILISQRLSQMGIPATRPRAIYRTSHRTVSASYLRDDRRMESHADIRTPDERNEPVLVGGYDYYTVWDQFAGLGPVAPGETYDSCEIGEALERGIITSIDYDSVMNRTREMLKEARLTNEQLEDYEFHVFSSNNQVQRDEDGRVKALFNVDCLTAYEIGLLDEERYRDTMLQLQAKLRAADCEKIDLKGSHALVSMNPDGNFVTNPDNSLQTALCNFEFIRGLYRPIR